MRGFDLLPPRHPRRPSSRTCWAPEPTRRTCPPRASPGARLAARDGAVTLFAYEAWANPPRTSCLIKPSSGGPGARLPILRVWDALAEGLRTDRAVVVTTPRVTRRSALSHRGGYRRLMADMESTPAGMLFNAEPPPWWIAPRGRCAPEGDSNHPSLNCNQIYPLSYGRWLLGWLLHAAEMQNQMIWPEAHLHPVG